MSGLAHTTSDVTSQLRTRIHLSAARCRGEGVRTDVGVDRSPLFISTHIVRLSESARAALSG